VQHGIWLKKCAFYKKRMVSYRESSAGQMLFTGMVIKVSVGLFACLICT
jgi:hypothetical protein